jgi:mRNA interferase RelE/StbE
MTIVISSRAEKQLTKLSKLNQIAVANKIRNIGSNSTVAGEEKLRGFKDIYRVRISDYRIVYRKSGQQLYIVLIGHRRDIYQLLRQLMG